MKISAPNLREIGCALLLSSFTHLSALFGVQDDTFLLTATSANFEHYYPTYLSNGYHSINSSIKGTDAALSLVVGLSDRAKGDVSRPAALPNWNIVDYHNGSAWLNEEQIKSSDFSDYRQTLDMQGGLLTTRYTWKQSGKDTGVEVVTMISQADPHLGACRLILTPAFSGLVRLRFPLGVKFRVPQRQELAKASWSELKDSLADGPQTIPIDPPAGDQPKAPKEILTWFDLQESLAAQGRRLKLPGPTAPNRASIWYPGGVVVAGTQGDISTCILTLKGQAIEGDGFSEAVAVGLPSGLANPDIREVGEQDGIALELRMNFEAGHTYEFTKIASVSKEGWGEGLAGDVERARHARAAGFSNLVEAQKRAWAGLWRSRIIVDGDADLQRLINSDLFYLLQNSNSEGLWPTAACGMSPHYFGHVFWDNDSWNFPVLLLLHPERAKALVEFRQRTLGWALDNARRHGFAGAMYPWESDLQLGNEQTPHFAGVNSEREIHLNGDIAIAQWQYYLATNDTAWLRTRAYPVIRATAEFWLSRVTPATEPNRYEITHVTSTDEKYTDVNNESFTNAVAQKNLRIAQEAAEVLHEPVPPAWGDVARGLIIPFSSAEQRFLMFDESTPHNRRTWMGGGVTFLAYPDLDLAMSPVVRRNTYDYALRKMEELSPEPNQMMLVMLAIHAAELGEGTQAMHWLRYQQDRFLKPPFNVRSETPGNNCLYLLAAGSGSLQNFLYGFTGLRLTSKGLEQVYSPVLPPNLTGIRLTGIHVRGQSLDCTITRDLHGGVQLSLRPAG